MDHNSNCQRSVLSCFVMTQLIARLMLKNLQHKNRPRVLVYRE